MRDNLGWILLLCALLLAMLLTLRSGGNRSRHGYGVTSPSQGSPLSTGRPYICQAQIPPQRLYTSG